MKLLLLLRHASATGGANVGDHDRPLSARGRAEAATVASRLTDDAVTPGLALVSTARRALETADALAEAGVAVRVVATERLYLAPADDVLAEVHDVDDAVERLLVVGHNPGLQRLALALADGDGDDPEPFPPASLAGFAFAVDRWRDVAMGAGRSVVSHRG